MTHPPSDPHKPRRGALRPYAIAALAALLMVALQAWQVAGHYRLHFMSPRHDEMVSQFTGLALQAPWKFLPLLGTVLLGVLLHVLMYWGFAWLYRAGSAALRPALRDRVVPLLLWLLAGTTLLVLWNDRLFPRSMVFPNSDVLARQAASPVLFWGLNLLFAAAACVALASALRSRGGRWAVAAVGAMVLAAWVPLSPRGVPHKVARSGPPDVILIGLDSVRPEYLHPSGYPDKTLTPAINGLASQLVLFDDTVTPLARTFVAYMSLLTGQYPVRHGARFNLYPRSEFRHDHTLAHRLRKAGYTTAYTTDETRFANIDASFGFDHVAVPPVGVSDFVLGAMLDSLATNLLALTPPARHLLPNLHGNRAAARIYSPGDHAERVAGVVRHLAADRPALLIAHFCLPHWPFTWRTADVAKSVRIPSDPRYAETPAKYLDALHATDSQVAQLLDALRKAGRLDNAVVVLFSDHGESLMMPRDFLETLGEGAVDGNRLSGHGAFALADGQQRVLLGMQRFRNGQPLWRARHEVSPASLVDMAPSVLEAAGVAYDSSDFDGLSLAGVAAGRASLPADRPRFVESGLSGGAVETTSIDEATIASELSHLYQVRSDLRIEVAPKHLPGRLLVKQRGVYAGDKGLATKPGTGPTSAGQACWQLADFKARTIRCIDDPQRDPAAAPLQDAVCKHFASDPGFAEQWCRGSQPTTAAATALQKR